MFLKNSEISQYLLALQKMLKAICWNYPQFEYWVCQIVKFATVLVVLPLRCHECCIH